MALLTPGSPNGRRGSHAVCENPGHPDIYAALKLSEAKVTAIDVDAGGLPLPEVFNRLRLRVNEVSTGAQVPWDSQKVDTNFTFFGRAPDASRRRA